MSSIVDEYVQTNNITLDNTTWNLHIRLGDVIEQSKYSAEEHYNKSLPSVGPTLAKPTHAGGYCYIEPKEFYLKKIKKVKEDFDGLDSVTIYSSYHGVCPSHNKTDEYLEKIIGLFEEHGIHVKTQIDNQDIDLDFVKLCKSKYYTPSHGGFTRLITKLVLNYGNSII
jgi:hypothetical protein